MSKEKPKGVKFTTGRGAAVWPKLDTPDTKYKDAGEYTIKIRLKGAAAEEAIRVIDAEMEKSAEHFAEEIAALKAKEKNPKKRAEIKERADIPYKEIYNDQDEPTGEYELNFKMLASGVSKKTGKPWSRRPALFDAAGKPLKNIPKVGGGSIVKISGELQVFHTAALGAGVSLRLEAVQIIELRTFEDRDASQFGFGAEEGSFEAEDAVPAPTPDNGEPATGDDF